MKGRDIVIGLLILAALGGAIYLRQRARPPEEMRVSETLSLEEELEEKFKLQIPEDVDKAELKDVTGGNSSGIATRKFADGKFTHTVLADLPDSESGMFYQGWLIRGEEGSEDFSLIATGQMRLAKGGYLLEFESTQNYTDHASVVITLEEVSDRTPEKHILEGTF